MPQKDSVNSPNFQEVESPDSASQDVKINSGWSADSIEETKNESQPPAEMSEESSEVCPNTFRWISLVVIARELNNEAQRYFWVIFCFRIGIYYNKTMI